MTKRAKEDLSSSDLSITIINRVIRRIRNEGRPLTLETVCQEIEEYKTMPTLADKVTTGMVRQVLSTFQ
ncbi:MAG: hypothetical protein ABSC17_04785 [Thermacetogeniaceae bacterium]